MRIKFFLFALVVAMTASVAHADDTLGFHDPFARMNEARWYVSNGWTNGPHQSCEWRPDALRISSGDMRLTLSDRGGKIRPIGCPEIHTKTRLSYGLYETRMRSAAGSGLNTAFFTYIGPPNGVPEWDEIDFEFLGRDPHTVSINHYTNGKPYDTKVVQLGFDASQGFHNYAFDWQPDKIRWYVDGKQVAETPAGSPIPSHPGNMFFSLWSGSDVENSWMGPFSYTAPVTADVMWAAYTPNDGTCQFPESLKCKR